MTAARVRTDASPLNRYTSQPPADARPAASTLRAGSRSAPAAAVSLLIVAVLAGAATDARAQIQLPRSDSTQPIRITAETASRWTEGVYEVWVLSGNCSIEQGADMARGQSAALWIERTQSTDQRPSKVIAYLEGDVAVNVARGDAPTRLTDRTWLGRFETAGEVAVEVPQVGGPPADVPPIYQRGMARRQPVLDNAIRRTQFNDFSAPAAQPLPDGARRIRVYGRSSVPPQLSWDHDLRTNQWIGIVTGGVNIVIEGLGGTELMTLGVSSIDVDADRLVIWTSGLDEPDVFGERLQSAEVPLEIYMEGNIVFREGERTIYANRMYYDAGNRIGTVLDAELLTPAPSFEGLLRMRAATLQQTGEGRFFAEDAFITSSRLGFPSYRVQSNSVFFEDTERPVIDPATGGPLIDAEGEAAVDHDRMAVARNNFLYLGDLPILYWPVLATNLDDPSFYIRRVRFKNDSIFGTQALIDFDAYELLGIRNRPEGTDWDFSLDYMSKRGLGHGTTFTYKRDDFLGLPGPAVGLFDYWGIYDNGLDRIGDYPEFEPLKDYRYRLFWQHRQLLPGDYQLSASLHWLSDRYLLEQYFEREWDELSDLTNSLELKKILGNASWSLYGEAQLNREFTDTSWLRLDQAWLGQDVADAFTWYEFASVGYGQLRAGEPPGTPVPYAYDPWELGTDGLPLDIEGERLLTRQELDYPFQLGVVKVVPYALGELGHWGELRDYESEQRAYGQAGIRASLPIWRVDPSVSSVLWNLNGIAHKVVFDAELSVSGTNVDPEEMPLWDPLDDNPIEEFRHRFIDEVYGGFLPERFDPRFYAIRYGMGSWVTAPSHEVAGDLVALRMGMRHRWQTKRGRPGEQRIVDWITLDTETVIFPKDEQNFGALFGLTDYDFKWHVGDRLTLASSGIFDFFDEGQRVFNVGGFLHRPPRGSLYLGIRVLDGPVSSTVLNASFSYRLSPKWISTFGTSFDLGDNRNIGQSLSVTRIGESFLVSAGVVVDANQDNVGAMLSIEPRFLSRSRLGDETGATIFPSGAFGLE